MTEAQPTGTAYPDIVEGRLSQIAGAMPPVWRSPVRPVRLRGDRPFRFPARRPRLSCRIRRHAAGPICWCLFRSARRTPNPFQSTDRPLNRAAAEESVPAPPDRSQRAHPVRMPPAL